VREGVTNVIRHSGASRCTVRLTPDSVEVIDNGVGIDADRLTGVMNHGIGLRNVNERLRVIYGANYQLQLDSVPGGGTCARVVIPELVVPARITA
jgi:two-component system sensor histidine kinase DesK